MGGAITVQGGVGPIGGKASTTVSAFAFNSMAEINGFHFGTNSDGLHKLNSGVHDNGLSFVREFTLQINDLGSYHHKRIRFLYFGVETDSDFKVLVKFDNKEWVEHRVVVGKTGLQEIRVPISREGYGRFCTVKVVSSSYFRMDRIDALAYRLTAGRRG